MTRKDLKRNDLVETVGRTVEYVSSHRRGATEIGIAAAGIALLVAGFFLVKLYRENRAGQELSAGLAALEAPLATDPGGAAAPLRLPERRGAQPGRRRALPQGRRLRGTAPGRAAGVILAARVEKPPAAAETFARAARDGRAEIAAAAEIDAARLAVSQGKTTEAIERLKRAIDAPASTVPKDALLFALAQVYEGSGATSDARATYQRIVNDYPNSPYRADARRQAEPANSPNRSSPAGRPAPEESFQGSPATGEIRITARVASSSSSATASVSARRRTPRPTATRRATRCGHVLERHPTVAPESRAAGAPGARRPRPGRGCAREDGGALARERTRRPATGR